MVHRIRRRGDSGVADGDGRHDQAGRESRRAIVLGGELGDAVVDARQFVERRQEHDPEEPIRGIRAEARAVDAEHALRAQQAEDVVLVGAARRQRHRRHRVERAARRDAGHARDRVHAVGRQLRALFERLVEHGLMRAVARQRRRHRVLHRPRTAQPAVGQLLDPRERVVQPRRAADDHPARAPARCEIRLRQ